ncbi:MAG TPA: outer membrane beta-barrel protein [Stellaceae bacterium]|nr:outer membrane beta-barrel protein [Stellaceae bacterium]
MFKKLGRQARITRLRALGGAAVAHAAVLTMFGGAAVAQSVQSAAPIPVENLSAPGAEDRLSVSQRPRPDYDELGARVGGFIIKPAMDLSEMLDTNIFATKAPQQSDFVTDIMPGVDVVSDFSRHSLSLQASGDIRRFARSQAEDVENFVTAANGRYDISDSNFILLGGGFQQQHEDRGSPDAVNGINPTQYHVANGTFGYNYTPYRVGFTLDSSVTHYSFDNVPTSSGTVINQTGRDRTEYGVTPRLSYEIIPAYRAFIQSTYNQRDYDHKFDASGFQRSSHGYSFALGTGYEISRIINGEVYVGYQNQSYDDSRLKDNGGVIFGGNLLWNPTQLTSVKLNIARTIEETTLTGASGYFQTVLAVTGEHELLRNLLLSVTPAYVRSEYQGISRTDDYFQVSAGMKYLVNHRLSLGAQASYRMRSTTISASDYDREQYTVSGRLQF